MRVNFLVHEAELFMEITNALPFFSTSSNRGMQIMCFFPGQSNTCIAFFPVFPPCSPTL
ncbi:hypothetical protein SLEP1_g24244 [Rubroshorea leprosula]|uniref:Uncharacterized protein n=1 Tax=Rubroshorea leprosula TaxID=152421 RepID=A0AAV5JF02_9ROSI|nr:hypothetical protein SLEP1_g24244 [Rubroshorea leprosula]